MKSYHVRADHQDIFDADWPYVKKLFQNNKKQYFNLIPFMARYVFSRLLGYPLKFYAKGMRTCYLSIDPVQARLLYQIVLHRKPKQIAEYGTSFGLSTLYLAAGLRKVHEGELITVDNEQNKTETAKKHLEACKLSKWVTCQHADAVDFFNSYEPQVDLLFMDGFPALNLSVFQALEKNFSDDALIIVDDVLLFEREMKDFLSYLDNHEVFQIKIVKISSGMAFIGRMETLNDIISHLKNN